ncbi:hypothetical protein MKX01_037363 [Papaver californicum]|nr:hypothetical protein MKX01_037363 [Papaver californicum]
MAVSNNFAAISSKILKSSSPKTFFTNQQRIPSKTQVSYNPRNPVHNLFYNANSSQKPSIQSLPYPNYSPVQNLFTGIVEEMGEIKQLGYAEDGGFEMKISGNVILEDVKLGDSISVNEECFNFMLIAYTQQNVVTPLKKVEQKVNMEVDILGKYVERLLQSGFTSNITPKESFVKSWLWYLFLLSSSEFC